MKKFALGNNMSKPCVPVASIHFEIQFLQTKMMEELFYAKMF